jgi:hypothetical protein
MGLHVLEQGYLYLTFTMRQIDERQSAGDEGGELKKEASN